MKKNFFLKKNRSSAVYSRILLKESIIKQAAVSKFDLDSLQKFGKLEGSSDLES